MQFPKAWLQGVSLGEYIACELRLQIINETIPRGEILSENRIAGEFGASRSPVREALRTLSTEGLIRLERMGAVVLGLSLQEVEELYDVRYLIESFAQSRLAGRQQESLLPRLEQAIDRMKLAVKYGDVVEFSLQDFTFHESIILEAHHTRILHLWNSIRQMVMTVMLITNQRSFQAGAEHMNWVAEKHHTIVQALRSGDAEVIRRTVETYFADSAETLVYSLPHS